MLYSVNLAQSYVPTRNTENYIITYFVKFQIGVGPFVSVPELVSVVTAPDSSNVVLLPDAASFSDSVVNNVSASLCNSK